MSQQKQEWHNSGSSCCSPIGTCCMAWFCPCILHGKTRHRVRNNGDMSSYSCCNSSCMGFCGLLACGVGFILPWISRADMRAKYGLEGNGCKDCLCACCCGPCDMVQQSKEAEFREDKVRLVQGQPGKNGGMYYAPQQ
ncbi:unnamed protein product [Periconia digitata]|uniref:PLAC8-domain-containing protein n=1 Tax=Periconia digitata TaxID=1303443 RepID=A0A9W4UE09_9PLEO|nr:unnamed protein product [Periconia digitata]